MDRDDMINALTKAGYFYKWSKFSNSQLFRIYQEKIDGIKTIKKPIYAWYIQDDDRNWIETYSYKRYRELCKRYKRKGFKIQTGEHYESKEMANRKSK